MTRHPDRTPISQFAVGAVNDLVIAGLIAIVVCSILGVF